MNDVPLIYVGITAQPKLFVTLHGAFAYSESGRSVSGDLTAWSSGDTVTLEENGARHMRDSEITLVPSSPDCTFELRDVMIGVQFHWQRKEDQRFVGSLKLKASGGSVSAVNIVNVEDYLSSVISSEMSARSSSNLLRAHAITSRSWLLAQLEKARRLKADNVGRATLFQSETELIRWYDREDHIDFDVCADDHCQRYQGITGAYTPSVAEAVKATRGQVLIYDNAICDARFSKCCGGVTELFENVWEPVRHSYLACIFDGTEDWRKDVPDFSREGEVAQWFRSSPRAFCNTRDPEVLSQVLPSFDQETKDFYRWNVSYGQEELAELIHRRSGIDFGSILALVPVERGTSGRLTKLKIAGSRKTLTIGKELEIRRLLSNSHLYSSAFVVEESGNKGGVPPGFVLHGAGWGHGVGLCQIGAAVMGELGYTHEKILSHYFPLAAIKRIY